MEDNPKKLEGSKKDPLHLIPSNATKEMAHVLKLGADKYGEFNWRTDPIEPLTYIGAIRRHLDAWAEGEDLDPESYQSHIAHIMASCAIVLDSIATDNFIDNRYKSVVEIKPLNFSESNNEIAKEVGVVFNDNVDCILKEYSGDFIERMKKSGSLQKRKNLFSGDKYGHESEFDRVDKEMGSSYDKEEDITLDEFLADKLDMPDNDIKRFYNSNNFHLFEKDEREYLTKRMKEMNGSSNSNSNEDEDIPF